MTRTPERIENVSQGQLSIARHYGGIIFNGKEYVYNPKDDCLIRADIFKKARAKNSQGEM